MRIFKSEGGGKRCLHHYIKTAVLSSCHLDILTSLYSAWKRKKKKILTLKEKCAVVMAGITSTLHFLKL